MRLFARAKINLTLEILEGQDKLVPPGYHSVRSIMTAIELADILHLSKGDNGIYLTVNNPDVPVGQSNLVVKAAELFFKTTDIVPRANFHLEKNIPIGSGLGGGSSDAAAALIALNELYETGLSKYDLEKLGASLGADVPFCVRGNTAVAAGIGDRLQTIPDLPEIWFLLIIPSFSVETKWAYNMLDEWRLKKSREDYDYTEKVCSLIYEKRWDEVRGACKNDFQEMLEFHYPIMKSVQETALKNGADQVILTGSGSALVAWVKNEQIGKRLADSLSSQDVRTMLTRTWNGISTIKREKEVVICDTMY